MRLITHSYDTYDQAARAVHALEAAGVPHSDITLVSGDKDRVVSTGVTDDTVEEAATGAGTGASLGTVLGGGAGLLAGIGALAIPGIGPIVAAGWLIATLTGAGVGAAAGGLLGSLTGAGHAEEDARTYAEHIGRGGTLVSVQASDTMATEVEYILEHGTAQVSAPIAAAVMPAAPLAPVAPIVATAAVAGLGDKIEVLKEELVVGKREVAQGGISVTSRIVETPVEEQVSLREERITLDRRPINRPMTGVMAEAFRDRTLTATARSEEAVVAKDIRVVEEIGLRKDVSERVETVHDTVRETKVEIEQVPGTASIVGVTGVTGATTKI